MRTIIRTSIVFLITVMSFCYGINAKAQITIQKNGDEYFNGDDRHIYAYLNNNYHNLEPIEGIWLFNRIELNNWGGEISRTNNEFQIAIIRDNRNVRRAFIEVNLSRALCKKYRITYSIQTGGNNIYPCLPEGCSSVSSQYVYNAFEKTIRREAVSLTGNRAVLIGSKIFPQGPPTEKMPMPGGIVSDDPSKVTNVKPRPITNKNGWEAYIDWGRNIFPSYILSTGTLIPKHTNPTDYKGDPLSNLGILIDNPRSNTEVKVEIEATQYTKAVSESFTLPKRGDRYAIFPKVSWDYERLKLHTQAFPLDFTFKVWINGKQSGNQTLPARIRAIDDCPLMGRNYRGELEKWDELVAAYVNEGHPKIKEFTKEILKKNLVNQFVGTQAGPEPAIAQVFAFWKLLRDQGIVYSSITDNGEQGGDEVASQRIRLFEDVVDDVQANCIDGSAILASCLKAVSINPLIVLIPGHAFLGYIPNPNFNSEQSKEQTNTTPPILFLETTLIGSKTVGSIEALTSRPEFSDIKTELIAHYNYTKKVMKEHFSKTGIYMQDAEIEHFAYASAVGYKNFLKAYEKNKDDVSIVNIAKSRETVKPITRASNAYIPVTPQSVERDVQAQQNVSLSNSSSFAPSYQTKSVYTDVPSKSSYKYQGKGTKTYDDRIFNSNAEQKKGVYYKVQLEFLPKYDSNKPTYTEMQKMGRMDIEYLPDDDKKFYRVLIGDFNTYNDAVPIARKAKNLGFEYACIVRYQDGNRAESFYTFGKD